MDYSSNIWKLNLIRMFFWMHFFAAVLVPFYTERGGLKLSHWSLSNTMLILGAGLIALSAASRVEESHLIE